jgi:large subunit ribosomal protein L24
MFKKKILEKKMKSNFIKGDRVLIITGNDKGKIGEVLEVNTLKGTIKVTDVCIQTHFQKSDGVGASGLIKKEGWVQISNVSHICEDGKATKIKRIRTENGLKIFSKRTNEDLRLKSNLKKSTKITLDEDKAKKESEKIKKEKFKQDKKEKDISFHDQNVKGKKKGDK